MEKEPAKKWGQKPYHSLDYELKRLYGGKVYKLSLQTGCSCPNRDGTKGTGGCIFCSAGGSGDFAADKGLSVTEQIEEAKKRVESKLNLKGNGQKNSVPVGYIAYFQSFSNTYGDTRKLEKMFREAIENPEILILSIATRPDCISEEMYSVLEELNRIKPVWVELGLQTIHENTARFIRRGYELAVFEETAKRLKEIGISVIAHVIIGLPGETREMIRETAVYLGELCADRLSERSLTEDAETDKQGERERACGKYRPEGSNGKTVQPASDFLIDGIKLHLLHIMRGTELAALYERKALPETISFSMEEYVDFVTDLLELLPERMIVHRITGDSPKKLLIAPLWSADKKRVLNCFSKRFKERGSFQGRLFRP